MKIEVLKPFICNLGSLKAGDIVEVEGELISDLVSCGLAKEIKSVKKKAEKAE